MMIFEAGAQSHLALLYPRLQSGSMDLSASNAQVSRNSVVGNLPFSEMLPQTWVTSTPKSEWINQFCRSSSVVEAPQVSGLHHTIDMFYGYE